MDFHFIKNYARFLPILHATTEHTTQHIGRGTDWPDHQPGDYMWWHWQWNNKLMLLQFLYGGRSWAVGDDDDDDDDEEWN